MLILDLGGKGKNWFFKILNVSVKHNFDKVNTLYKYEFGQPTA